MPDCTAAKAKEGCAEKAMRSSSRSRRPWSNAFAIRRDACSRSLYVKGRSVTMATRSSESKSLVDIGHRLIELDPGRVARTFEPHTVAHPSKFVAAPVEATFLPRHPPDDQRSIGFQKGDGVGRLHQVAFSRATEFVFDDRLLDCADEELRRAL